MRNISQRVPNNDKKIQKQIDKLQLEGVRTWIDDGNVGVDIQGNKKRFDEVVSILNEKFSDIQVGDGVQQGELFINSEELNIHEELSSL